MWTILGASVGVLATLVFFGLLPDYFALWKTRYLVGMLHRGSLWLAITPVIDLVLSFAISYICATILWVIPIIALSATGMYMQVTEAGISFSYDAHASFIQLLNRSGSLSNWYEISAVGVRETVPDLLGHVTSLRGLLFLSTLFTSIWTILIVLSTVALKLLAPVENFTAWFIDVKEASGAGHRHRLGRTGHDRIADLDSVSGGNITMQNRYVGDIGDYVKLGILRALSPGHHVGVAWWLYPDEGHNRDGRHIGYLSQPARWRHFDPDLFDALHQIVSYGQRNVQALEAANLLPCPIFASEVIPTGGPIMQRRRARQAWFQVVQQTLEAAELVFLDPDNGLEPIGFSHGYANAGKSILLSEDTCRWQGQDVA